MKILITSFAVFLLALSALSQEVPPSWKMITAHSEHFDLILNAERQQDAPIYLSSLERARTKLSTRFTLIPSKLIVVIADKTDSTNGYAVQVPYPRIVLYPVIPGGLSSLGDYNQWLDELIIHEMVHILTFHAVTEPMSYLKNIFGNIAAPNILLPSWWKEGIAVEFETNLSRGGRNRSPTQDATIRAMIEDKTYSYFDIARANESLPLWPEGMAPYLYGGIFWAQNIAESGPQSADSLFLSHGGRIPYFIDAPAIDTLGKTYEDSYNAATLKTQIMALQQIEQLKSLEPTRFEKIISDSLSSSSPSISPKGDYLALFTTNKIGNNLLRVFERNKANNSFLQGREIPLGISTIDPLLEPTKEAPPGGAMTRISWMHKSPRFVFDKIDSISSFERYSDLWIHDLKTNKSKQITTGLRGREPSVSPNDDVIAFVQLSANQTTLAVLDLASMNSRTVFQPAPGERISYPQFIDAQNIVFSYTPKGQTEALYTINLQLGSQPKQFSSKDFPTVRFAELGANGSLYFTSTQNGVRNIYSTKISEPSKALPLTHTLTQFSTFAVDTSTNDLYATVMTGHGQEVVLIKNESLLSKNQALPKLSQGLFESYYEKSEEAKTAEPEISISYSEGVSAQTLWPLYWVPFISSSTSGGGSQMMAMTSGHDPLHRHEYSGQLSFDTGTQQTGYVFQYKNRQNPTHWTGLISQDSTPFGVGSNFITSESFELMALPNIFSWNRNATVSVGLKSLSTGYLSSKVGRLGPTAMIAWNDYSKSNHQISPESGMSAFAGVSHYVSGSNLLSHNKLNVGGNYYFSKFLPARHALAFKWASSIIPENISSIYGTSSAYNFIAYDSTGPSSVMRGYSSGTFLGKTFNSINTEYRLPLASPHMGYGTVPLFLSRVTAAIILDAASLDGHYWDTSSVSYRAINTKNVFVSKGAELRVETNIGYLLPFSLILGIYMPQDQNTNMGLAMMISQSLF